jgi:hypothetical protein
MALQFFRKHRKWGNVLLLAAMFAMVTFGALMYAGDAWIKVKSWITGEDPNNPTVRIVHGENVPWRERQTARVNLALGLDLARYGQAMLQQRGMFQQGYTILMTVSRSGMINRFAEATKKQNEVAEKQSKAAENEGEDPLGDVIDTTVVLLREARDVGIVVTDQDIRDGVLAAWEAYGITGDVKRDLLARLFRGQESWLYSLLRQEMTLVKYLDVMLQHAKIVEPDVWTAYRTKEEKATIRYVDLQAASYRREVEASSDDEIQAHFDKYKDVLPDDPEQPFGYKAPQRIQFQYMTVDAKAIEADLSVTDEEISEYYEANKDQRFVKPPEPKVEEKADETSGDAKEDDSGAAMPKAPAPEKPADSNDGDTQPAKTLDAPNEEPGQAAADAAPADVEPAADVEPVADETPAATAVDAPETDVETPAVPAVPEEPKKEYKSLAEVRDEIAKTLRQQKARVKAADLAADALRALRQYPKLKLDNVDIEKKYMHVYRVKDFKTAEQVAKVPGIGESMPPMASRGGRAILRFADMAFSRVEGLTDKPLLMLNSVADVILTDAFDNCYIFIVTGSKKAEAPALDAVRSRVVNDLKAIASYGKAELAAGMLIKEAGAEGGSLHSAARREKKFTVRRKTVSRRGQADPVAEAVFKAIDDGGRFGTVPDKTYKQVTVFEVVRTRLTPKSEFLKNADQIIMAATREAAGKFLEEFTKTEEVFRRSGLKRVKLPESKARVPRASGRRTPW